MSKQSTQASKINRTRNRQRGLGMLEFIVIVVLLGYGANVIYNFYFASESSTQANAEGDMLRLYNTKIKARNPGRIDYTGLSTASMISSKAFPDSMQNGAGTAYRNVWSGDVTFAPTGTNGFQIVYTNVPPASCVELVNNAGSAFRTVSVGSTTVKTQTQPVPVNTAVEAACAAGTTDITFGGV